VYRAHVQQDIQEGKANTNRIDMASTAYPFHSYSCRAVCLLDRYQPTGKFALSTEQTSESFHSLSNGIALVYEDGELKLESAVKFGTT
jgi:hypothetical protein